MEAEIQAVALAYDKLQGRAYELGRWAYTLGLTVDPFVSRCPGLSADWDRGWRDEKAGRP